MERVVLNAAQREILNAMARLKTDEELMELKQAISEFFARRAQQKLDALWNQGVINEQKLQEWRTAHFRTPYKQ